MLDSGNLIPGSAAMSMEFADKIGVRWEPYQLDVGTAAQGGNLEVVGLIPTLEMTIALKLTLILTDTLVIRDLSHPPQPILPQGVSGTAGLYNSRASAADKGKTDSHGDTVGDQGDHAEDGA